MNLKSFDIVGENCITSEAGAKVRDLIRPELRLGHEVHLDFASSKVFASPFFNSAIGQLLTEITPESLQNLLKIENLTEDGKQVLQRVLENAKRYYTDANSRKALDEILEERAENR